MEKGAIISECGRYRFQLDRVWDKSLPVVLFIILNPSTADGDQDDNTIRRCICFAKDWGYGGILVGNLFAFKATKPKDLRAEKVDRGDGVINLVHLSSMIEKAKLVVCGWGGSLGKMPCNTLNGLRLLGLDLYCLGKTKGGQPRHPLFIKKDLGLDRFYFN